MGTNAYYLNQFISTTLATVGGIDDSQTTGIILTSVTGVETTKPGIVCLSYSDPIDTSKAEWISYTSISVTNELQGVTRGAEGFSAKSHSNGVTIAFPISESHINNLNDALIIGGSATNLATGVIDDDTFATASATKLATSESIKAYVDNSPDSIYRQAIINGNFDVWQRGTSFSGSGVFTADRWKYGETSATAHTISKQDGTGVNGSQYCIRVQRNSGETATPVMILDYTLESVDSIKFRGQKITVSFYARKGANYSATSDILQLKFATGTGTDQAVGAFTNEVDVPTNFTLTTDWQKFTFTTSAVIGSTISQLGLRFLFNPTGTAGVADYFEMTQVQLCAGEVALPFMPKSYEEELRACMRYYWVVINGSSSVTGFNGYVRTANSVFVAQIQHPVQMRIAPTLEVNSTTDFSLSIGDLDTTSTNISITGSQSSPQKSRLTVSFSATISSGLAGEVYGASANTRLSFNAEL